MNFLAFPIQPAAGVSSRVQLPAVSRSAFAPLNLIDVKTRPLGAAATGREQPRGGLLHQRAQHRAQCRANCMSKANF